MLFELVRPIHLHRVTSIQYIYFVSRHASYATVEPTMSEALERLNRDQRESYQQFVDITNWEADPEAAIALLRSAAWNVEVRPSLVKILTRAILTKD